MVGGIGSARLEKLLSCFNSPCRIFESSSDRLSAIAGIGEKLAYRISSFDRKDLEKELKLSSKLGLKITTIQDSDYPVNLKNIPGPPIVLYIKGALKEQDKLAIGLVGSRRASFYGLNLAEKFSCELAACNITVISGMARGIDTYAHKGALRGGGRTLAVMGSGFANIYPPENKELSEEIASSGAVISEFAISEKPLKENFPRRNRLISGLSLGVLVAEAAKNSGAMITADFALEQGRDVFAIPGKIDSLYSSGTNALIKQGAKLVTDVSDILEELGLELQLSQTHCVAKRHNFKDEREDLLYGLINERAVLLDELVDKSNMDIPVISAILLKLELKKLIVQLPGKYFVRSQDEEKKFSHC
jgi:DNA processing protein